VRNSLRDDPILGPAYEYWQSKCGGRAMPRRRDVDPTEIPRLLPHLQITEFVDGGKRIRYRLAGTAVVEAYGGELKGKYFDEVFAGERLKFVEDNYRLMCESKRPVLVRNRYFSPKKVPLVCHRLIMPLSDDGVVINQCLTAMRFEYAGESYEWAGQWFSTDPNSDFVAWHREVVD
jgi:hypothetical protein